MTALNQKLSTEYQDKHFDYLDGWRGLAILFLLIGHFFPVRGINFGRIGVDFFFVLSGLLMARLLFIKKVPIKTFYKRRIARIFPAHFAFLSLILVFFMLTGKDISWSETLMASLFVNNYFPAPIGHAVMPFGHIWSLSVEEHSYILLSLIALASRLQYLSARIMIAIGTASSIALGMTYWSLFDARQLEFELWGRSEISSFGILFSGLLVLCFQKIRIPTFSIFTYPLLILFGLFCYWWSIPLPVKGFIGVGVFAFVLNALATAPPTIQRIFSFAPLRKLGLWSFSLYLWQQVFYLMHRKTGLPLWSALGLAMACGIGSYYFIENPTRHFLNTRWANPRD